MTLDNSLIATDHADHAHDILDFLVDAVRREVGAALIVVTDTQGGSIRAPGAVMGVTEDGAHLGYVSNGCVDGDLIRQAQDAIAAGTVRTVRYGEGSPFQDVKLPCGGSIDLIIAPFEAGGGAALALIEAQRGLEERRPVDLAIGKAGGLRLPSKSVGRTGWSGDEFVAHWIPKIRIRIVGRGSEPLSLARIAHATGLDVTVQTPDADLLRDLRTLGGVTVEHLTTPNRIPPGKDDLWTAFVMMFHDREWELNLLQGALAGEAFYIGALGSERTHASRCARLREEGASEESIARIHGPIGLLPSMRNASMLAISVLAEVIEKYDRSARRL